MICTNDTASTHCMEAAALPLQGVVMWWWMAPTTVDQASDDYDIWLRRRPTLVRTKSFCCCLSSSNITIMTLLHDDGPGHMFPLTFQNLKLFFPINLFLLLHFLIIFFFYHFLLLLRYCCSTFLFEFGIHMPNKQCRSACCSVCMCRYVTIKHIICAKFTIQLFILPLANPYCFRRLWLFFLSFSFHLFIFVCHA